ncbi:hypothetical protein E2320_004925 [Naja naja]|nr:hypothetical protein E2320_004925 [Naja naja]
MEDWISSLKSVQSREHYEPSLTWNISQGCTTGMLVPTRGPLFATSAVKASGVTSHGLSCEVCKFKAHKRCAVRAINNCKWTTLTSIGRDIIEDEDGVAMPHQWLEGNLPVSAKCAVCDKTCGSVLRLQDWKCLWCKTMVHTACRDSYPRKCPLGQCKVSIIPPTALNSIDSDGFWKATCPPTCASPLLVFVNSKSGDNQGVKFLRRFKQSLNPAQVFDLMNGGPHLGLRLFQKFDNFRILVCGGDGSVGWVLWSIMSYELRLPSKQCILPVTPEEDTEDCQMSVYEDSVATHLTKILDSDQHSVVISSAKILCETVKGFVAKIGKTCERPEENAETDAMAIKAETQVSPSLPHMATTPIAEEEPDESSSEESLSDAKEPLTENNTTAPTQQVFKSREQLMLRANSLKKALRQIIEQAEKVVDEQNAHSEDQINQAAMEYNKELDESKEEKDEDTKEYESHPSLRAGLAASIAGSSIISKMLLANIDPYGATPLLILTQNRCYSEKCVMNNYFGIGLDAKISLEFNNKREEHPEKCRTKNMMWYGVLGTKELLQRTYKNLEQKVQLECRAVKITILGDEGVPVQVDGEAWIQPPGIIKIVHKNRAQMLTRDRAFESTLKSWEDKQKCDSCKPGLRSPLYPHQTVELALEEETAQIQASAKTHSLLEQELAHAVNACSHALTKGGPKFPESLTRNTALEIAATMKALHDETESLLVGKVSLQLESPCEELLVSAVHNLETELRKLAEIPWLCYILQMNDDEDPPLEYCKRNHRSTVFRIVPKFKKEKVQKQKTSAQPVQKWGTDEVAAWLELLNLGEYKDNFVSHDIRGAELLHLERRDLKDLGITKVGHMKRILQGIKEFGKSPPLPEL